MRYNPFTNRLYTSDGRFVKQLHCPKLVQWHQLDVREEPTARSCSVCERQVLDTSVMGREELEERLLADPGQCVAINLNTTNIIIDEHVGREKES